MNELVKLINEKKIYDGSNINIVERKFSFQNNKCFLKEIILSNPISVILPILDNNHIILVDQYRFGAKDNLLELPAGTIRDNEDSLACAKREIEEETGYKSDKWVKYNSFYSSPGLNNELIHFFTASELIKTKMKLDNDEILKPVIMEKEKISGLIINGHIIDAKTIIGLLMYFIFIDQKYNF